MTTDTRARRPPNRLEMAVLYGFHAAFSGAFLVAYLTGDEDTYGMHKAAGYLLLAALAVRLAAGLAAPGGSPLRLPRPSLAAAGGWLLRLVVATAAARRERSPLLAWMAVTLLAGVGVTAAVGAVADFLPSLEDLHEGLGEASLGIVIAHIALVLGLQALKTPAAILDALRAAAGPLRNPRKEAR
jgi:hypothetical protein